MSGNHIKADHRRTFRSFFCRTYTIVKWLFISFFIITIYLSIMYSFVRPRLTPLMVKRYVEYKKDHKENPFKHDWVPIEEISPNLVLAVVATEDNNFTQHFGFDISAIQKARDHNKRYRRKHGASTISQQTAKNVFLWEKRSYLRKGMEVYFTFLIEVCWSKKRIMEVYLNMIEMGPGIYGAEAAARHYFHKSASKLTRHEASLIAACLPNPKKRNPAYPSSYMLRRQERILSLMRKLGPVEL